jgi:hypothetical protein
MYGRDIDNFHARKERGELLPMTFFSYFEGIGSTEGSLDQIWDDGVTSNHQYSLTDTWAPEESWAIWGSSDLVNAMPNNALAYVQQAAAKIYGTGHDTLTFLAELTEVRTMFTGIIRKLLRLDLPPDRDYLYFINHWLEYRYGWRTLWSDILALNSALSSLDETRSRYSERSGTSYSYTDESTWDTDHITHVRTHTLTTKYNVGVRGAVAADVVIPKFQFNPIQTGWEIIPLSFVLDWLWNVGGALAAIRFLTLQTEYVASYGYRISFERSYNMETTWSAEHWDINNAQSGESEGSLTRRYPCSIPKLPQIRINIDTFKVFDLISLVLQRLSKHFISLR